MAKAQRGNDIVAIKKKEKEIKKMYELLIDKITEYEQKCFNVNLMPNIDDIKSIIQKAEPLIIDMPDQEGIWFNDKEYVKVILILEDTEEQFYAYWDDSARQHLSCEKAKWQKV